MNVTFKLYPTCAFNQSSVMSMMSSIRMQTFMPDQVTAIEIRMSPYEGNYTGIQDTGPFNQHLQTLMSSPFGLVLALEECKVQIADIWRFDGRHLNQLNQLATVVPDETLPENATDNQISQLREIKNWASPEVFLKSMVFDMAV